MAKYEGKCPCCDFVGILTKHHIYPKRHYGRHHGKEIFVLCRACHNELETYIPQQRMSHDFYPRILQLFIEGKKP